MKISTIFYCIRQGLKNIQRNKLFSLASIGTIVACIFLLGMFYSIIINVQHMVAQAEETVCITVFFDEGLTQDQIDEIGNVIRARSEVSKLEYTSAEQAWEAFKTEYFADNPELADGFKDDNPLANSANYQIYLKDISTQPAMVTYLQSVEGIRQVNRSEVVASTLSDFGKMVGYVSAAIIIILLAIAIFLISNTVTIGITVRREEIRIMKLIGATNSFIRAPFVIEGVLIGLIGAIIPIAILYFVYKNSVAYILSQFQIITGAFSFLPMGEVFAVMIPGALIIGAGIGLIGSSITIRKHLRV
ncbi:permease-like cell division protein FtsX [Parasporobacterium paucivorans]|uniref:Cell division protein FtsX n=1 Tax=Parasporobacterium paucivorans DSM 15970 TaxID=1122934 RepID=A0A1M6KVG9_9FIRM|nr:permease-like cell division protein FtsX [Parasporobacterium paucivorans]SHJ62890.1 cell division protein FtsX [Parasporobacterium paucivorans DSM 15970]